MTPAVISNSQYLLHIAKGVDVRSLQWTCSAAVEQSWKPVLTSDGSTVSVQDRVALLGTSKTPLADWVFAFLRRNRMLMLKSSAAGL
jgi:hypothetical protein